MPELRNFSIIAHIDHGKSTLADRLIQHTGMVELRDFRDQILDSMDIERERGITIKSQTVTLPYVAKDGTEFQLNLIDTPGHVDFSYEVSRALMSCEGVLLLVDASQGVEAQTLANLYAAMEQDLTVIPVINKIDLPSANVEMVKEQIEVDLGLDSDGAILCSAREGIGIEDVGQAIVRSDVSWVLVALALMAVSLFFRAQAWFYIARAALPAAEEPPEDRIVEQRVLRHLLGARSVDVDDRRRGLLHRRGEGKQRLGARLRRDALGGVLGRSARGEKQAKQRRQADADRNIHGASPDLSIPI